jgi:hypothetical protein
VARLDRIPRTAYTLDMKRLSLSLSVLAAVALSGCTGGRSAEPVKIVPDSATMIGGIDMGGLVNSKTYQGAAKRFPQLAPFESGLKDLEACKLDPKSMKFVLGANEKRQHVIVISGPGIGIKENVECLGKKAEASMKAKPAKFEEKDGWNTVKIDGGAQIGIMVNNDLFVVSERSWVKEVKSLIDGKEGAVAAVDGSLSETCAVADPSKTIWFAGQVPKDVESQSPVGQGSKAAAGYVDVSEGASIGLTAIFVDAATATKTADDAKAALEQAKPLVEFFGLPPSVKGAIDAVTIEAKGTQVDAKAKLSQSDIDLAMDKGVAMLGGGK